MKVHPNFSTATVTENFVSCYDYTAHKSEQFLVPPTTRIIQLETETETVPHLHPQLCAKRELAAQIIAILPEGNFYEPKARTNGYIYCFHYRQWMRKGQSRMGGSYNMNYNGAAQTDVTTAADLWKFGVEVEKDGNRDLYEGDYAIELLNNTKWAKENDVSLGSYGFELVSPIMPLLDDEIINNTIEPVRHLINGSASTRCGGHITISHNDLTSVEILDMMKWWAPLLYAMYPSRTSNTYCGARAWESYKLGGNKYVAFYAKNSSLLEIRLFPAVQNVAQLKWRIGLIRLILSQHFQNKRGMAYIFEKLLSDRSQLNKHFMKIYSRAKLIDLAERAVEMARRYSAGAIAESTLQKCEREIAEAKVRAEDLTEA